MKKIFFLIMMLGVTALYAQKKVAILGDSYSTFKGCVSPAWNYTWYGGDDGGNNLNKTDLRSPDQTWWRLLLAKTGYELLINNSFSGSTVCYTGYRKEDFSDRAFITRMCNLGKDPDIILVLSGTNDSWAGAPIGEYQYSDWKRSDLYAFRPAFCYMMHYLTTNYPNAQIVNICNSELKEVVMETQAEVCKHYGVVNVQLHDVAKQAGHPNIAGMQAICDQVLKVLK